ncbi:MAG: threonine aldolase family protein [Hyphomicrobiales bacterium]|nr:threonine aldolase family protein [Hyphomicrobiales bacterium]
MFDFRSDTVTKPTTAMMAAIAAAEVGDAARGDDPTTNKLESFVAKLTGKEAALFTPSGTMANLAALLTHVRPGEEVIVDEAAHIYNSEAGSMAAVAGAMPRPVRSEDGFLEPSRVVAAIRSGSAGHVAPTGLICLENTHNAAGGIVVPLANMAELYRVAKDVGLPVHLDGARLFNAAAYLNKPVADFCQHADTVMFALSKGLGAPIGSMLVGSKEFMARARKKARMLGGGMRQVGLIAAPALVALEDPFPRLRRDHDMAKRLAEGLATIDDSLVRVDKVQTNIVNCYVDSFASEADGFVQSLNEAGILANFARSKVRFVTHSHIDEAAVEACLAAVEKIVGAARRAA